MKRNLSNSRRWLWSLGAGVLLVPVMTVGAVADNPTTTDRGEHVKQSRAIAHVETDEAPVATVDRSMTKAEHEEARGPDCLPFIETDHPEFATDDEHKAFHGIPTDIDHSDDPVFSSAAEHKAFHGLPCGIGDPDFRNLEHGAESDDVADDRASRHEAEDTGSGDDADDGTEGSAELKEQPLDDPDESSRHDDPSAGHRDDTPDRHQESSEERTN